MRQSVLYRKAAELVDSGHSRYACHAIYELKRPGTKMSTRFFNENDPEALALSYLFSNPKYGNTLINGVFGKPEARANRDMRVMALLFMAAIVDTQE